MTTVAEVRLWGRRGSLAVGTGPDSRGVAPMLQEIEGIGLNLRDQKIEAIRPVQGPEAPHQCDELTAEPGLQPLDRALGHARGPGQIRLREVGRKADIGDPSPQFGENRVIGKEIIDLHNSPLLAIYMAFPLIFRQE